MNSPACPSCGAGEDERIYDSYRPAVTLPVDVSVRVRCIRCGFSTSGSHMSQHRAIELALEKWRQNYVDYFRDTTPPNGLHERMVHLAIRDLLKATGLMGGSLSSVTGKDESDAKDH